MIVHTVHPDQGSFALDRVMAALERYAPTSISWTNERREADLLILHVIGRLDSASDVVWLAKKRGQQIAVIQYVLRSTMRPSSTEWTDLWEQAALVWSYYDLQALCAEDGARFRFPFYRAPLGVDKTVFYPPAEESHRKYLLMTTGRDWLTESVREGVLACRAVGGIPIHLGSQLSGRNVLCFTDLTDDGLRDLYHQCVYVSGLRRTEGFELPAAEGLLCGARPILFDRPHYRDWYDGLADFIPEQTRENVLENIRTLLSSPGDVVTQQEIDDARERFDWSRIVRGFWERLT